MKKTSTKLSCPICAHARRSVIDRLLLEGHQPESLAQKLGIAVSTVREHCLEHLTEAGRRMAGERLANQIRALDSQIRQAGVTSMRRTRLQAEREELARVQVDLRSSDVAKEPVKVLVLFDDGAEPEGPRR